jgi:hypothetical protein
MADFKRVVLLDSIKPSQFFLDQEELEIIFVKSDFRRLKEDVYSTEERTLYTNNILSILIADVPVKVIENYKYDIYDIVYLFDGKELYKVHVF